MTASEREVGDRADFLAAVRRAVVTPHGHVTRPVEPLANPLPTVGYTTTPDDLVATFADALGRLGGVARVVDTAETAAALIDEALSLARRASDEPVRVAITAEPECIGLAEVLAARDDVEVLDYDNPQTVATADLGITGARVAVALTGSLVVDAGRAGGRTVSLLPPVHLVLISSEAFVATPGESWRAMTGPISSNVVQITGPSRSADIELIITLGVHGPRALIVGVLAASLDASPTSAEGTG